MHTLHFILINAESAKEAASETQSLILDWGDENNWRLVGGVASEDGSDDIENHDDARWGLDFLKDETAILRDGTYFSRAVAFLHRQIAQPVAFPARPHSTHPDLPSAVRGLSDMMREFNPHRNDHRDLWNVGQNLTYLTHLIDRRRALAQGREIPQFYRWQLDHFGLTDLTEESAGARRYLVFLDMHS